MGGLLTLLGAVMSIASVVCAIIILIDAFKNEVWKGIVCILCGFYMLYYAFAEFQHEKKVLILVGWLVAGIIGGGAMMAGSLGAALSAAGGVPGR